MKKALRYTLLGGLLLALLAFGSCSKPDASTEPAPTGTEIPVAIDPSIPANTDGAETVLIPAGTFEMGTSELDALADADEAPVHAVTLDAFRIYTHEVTNEQYAACVAAGACTPVVELASGSISHTSDPAYTQYPVVGVTWDMARDYCTWAGGRLPTEAEWEYAARGTESMLYPWGMDDPACDRTNMAGCQNPSMTVAVGSYALGNSSFGVWDMAGNVWEWTQDWYADSFYYFSPAGNPVGPYAAQDAGNPLKVARGGGMFSEALQLRSANRLGVNPERGYNDVGFRCVTGKALDLPASYEDAGGLLDFGGDDSAEDQDSSSLYVHSGSVSCPNADGNIQIDMVYEAVGDFVFEVSVAGAPFACEFDPATSMQHCTGPAPADFNDPAVPDLTILFHIEYPPEGIVADAERQLPKPVDCESADTSDAFNAEVSCPQDGFVTATFTYDNSDVTWQEIYLRSMDTPLPCEELVAGVVTCTAPDLPEDGLYKFYLYGENDEGLGRKRWPDVPAPEGCPAAGELEITTTTLCFLGITPTVEFFYDPAPHGSVSTVQDAGEFRIHVNWGSGVTESMFTDETPGHVTSMTLCFQDGYCQEVPDITVPDCSSSGAAEHNFLIESACYAPAEDDPFSPAASVRYGPVDTAIQTVTANGAALNCNEMEPGWSVCSVVPGDPGSVAEIEVCLANGECSTESIQVRDCPTPTTWHTYCDESTGGPRFSLIFDPDFNDGLDAVYDDGVLQTCEQSEPGYTSCTFKDSTPLRQTTMTVCFEGQPCFDIPEIYVPVCSATSEWVLAGVGCHPVPEPNHIAFMVDTGYEWLVDGTDVEYTATDGIRTYACITHPLVPGRIYCHGYKPEVPATLNLCLQQPGQPAECHTFSDYYDWVSYLTCPEPTEEPVVTNPCAGLSFGSCAANSSCKWIGPSTSGGYCTQK